MNIKQILFILWSVFFMQTLLAQETTKPQEDKEWERKFEQLGTTLPTPNIYRTASGAPGKEYWQQRADYKIDITLNDENQSITGKEQITYYNNSPDDLEYLWIQLDQNVRSQDSDSPLIGTNNMKDTIMSSSIFQMDASVLDYDGGFKIKNLKVNEENIKYVINKTMMRLDLKKPLRSGANANISIEWSYNINNRMTDNGRSGYEYFESEKNYLYGIAQFYPRMVVYMDNEGWQNKQFLGNGEFTLTFGNFDVSITVPSNFVVGATGDLQNPEEVLTPTQMKRLKKARNTFDKPVIIITQEEAEKNEKEVANGQKTWRYKAENVRDYAFCASKKFIWDAMAVKLSEKNKPLAMSYYPKEGNPLWEEWSTKAVAQTLKTYSKHTIEYSYPVAISVHTASIGMEYPMICFNYGRPQADGSYSDRLKYGMISVIIHEVGHNFFPMIINSDERQWTWMDEGLNSFMQFLTEKALDPNYPSRRGPAENMIPYMSGQKGLLRPIMTNSEQIRQFGNNAYGKPATALNVLRTTVMGFELFDKSFKTYAERWAFKHPTPADFFRTMEDASAVDLDWFWKGWFYGTDYVDVSLDEVKWYTMQTNNSKREHKKPKGTDKKIASSSEGTNEKTINAVPENFVFKDRKYSGEYRQSFPNDVIKKNISDKNFYELTLTNKGGLVTPVVIEWVYEDGTREVEKLPAEIWRINEKRIKKVFIKKRKVSRVIIDPKKQTTDINAFDNTIPRQGGKTDRFQQFKIKN